MGKKKVMFLCTGNSCRSQMTEGFARVLRGDDWEIYSAGIEPAGLNPRAVEVMRETGIDISMQTSDPIDPELLKKMDLAVTFCGDAEERCPMTPPYEAQIYFSDPFKYSYVPVQVLSPFLTALYTKPAEPLHY